MDAPLTQQDPAGGGLQWAVWRPKRTLVTSLLPPSNTEASPYTSPSFNANNPTNQAIDDNEAIRHLLIPSQARAGQTHARDRRLKRNLIGIPDGTNIRGLDGKGGWVYIRSMWIEKFEYHENGTRPGETDHWLGNADLKIVVWKFNNLIDSPGLDCSAQGNCTRHVYTAPLKIRVDSVDGTIQEGWFGLDCGPTFEMRGTFSSCPRNKFFKGIKGILNQGTGGTTGVDAVIETYKGRCCGPAEITRQN